MLKNEYHIRNEDLYGKLFCLYNKSQREAKFPLNHVIL